MSSGQIVLNYGDSLIRDTEIAILKSNRWINDAIIGFYFEYLGNQTENPDVIKFFDPAVTQLLKLIEDTNEVPAILGRFANFYQYAFWPVNDSADTNSASSGTHWSLLVFSRPDDKFLHLDSFGATNNLAARRIFFKCKKFLSSTATFETIDECYPQQNGRDCGLHVLLNAEIILTFIKISGRFPSIYKNGVHTATPLQAERMREDILELIEKLSKK